MRSRARAILAAAAALVAGGTALVVAIPQANRAAPIPLTCAELHELQAMNEAEAVPFYLAVAVGYTPPTVIGDRVLGDCAGGRCVVVQPNGCTAELAYRFTVSPAVSGWRLVEVRAHPYFAGGWQAMATAAGASNLRFWAARKDVAAACLAVLSAANCRTLLGGIAPCWRRADGTHCRYGRVYGPGVGGVDAAGNAVTCTVQAGDEWYSCDDGGSGRPDYAEAQRAAALPAELDLGQ